jgi:hypothetical protein
MEYEGNIILNISFENLFGGRGFAQTEIFD